MRIDIKGKFHEVGGISASLRNLIRSLDPTKAEWNLVDFDGAMLKTPLLSKDFLNKAVNLVQAPKNPDIVVHASPPHTWSKHPSAKNIGIIHWETNRLPSRPVVTGDGLDPAKRNFVAQCNLMDEILVVNNLDLKPLGVTKPYKNIVVPIDKDFWSINENQSYKDFIPNGVLGVTHDSSGKELSWFNKFKVGIYGDLSQKKNLLSAVKCALVCLPIDRTVIIVKGPAGTSKALAQLKIDMKIPVLPKVVVIENDLTDMELKGLMSLMNVYVDLSKASGDSLMAQQAAMMGIPTIMTAGTNSPFKSAIQVSSVPEVVLNPSGSSFEPYYSDMLWQMPQEYAYMQSLSFVQKSFEGNDTEVKKLTEQCRSNLIKRNEESKFI